MKRFFKTATMTAVLGFGLTMAANAEAIRLLEFTTDFSFYVGTVKMPAGTYRILQEGVAADELLLQSSDGKHGAFLEYQPTQKLEPHEHNVVTFQKYGNENFLNRFWVAGENAGYVEERSKAEKDAAASTPVSEHSIIRGRS